MTRNPKVPTEVLEREYVYDGRNPPISITELAAKHRLARSGVAAKAKEGRWFERREEFRVTLGKKTVEALGEEWVRLETAAREKALSIAMAYMDKYDKQLQDPEFKPNTRDFLGMMAMMRTYLGDAAAAKVSGEEVLIDPDTAPLTPEAARQVLADLERHAQLGPGSEAPAAGPEGAGED